MKMERTLEMDIEIENLLRDAVLHHALVLLAAGLDGELDLALSNVVGQGIDVAGVSGSGSGSRRARHFVNKSVFYRRKKERSEQ